MPSGISHLPRPSRGFRAGIVIGLAVAILGIAVGTVTGATTPFQQVLIVNAPASPVPVAGTVSVSNKVTKAFWRGAIMDPGTSDTLAFNQTVNITSLEIDNPDDDSLVVWLDTVGDEPLVIHAGGGGYQHDFTVPVPARSVTILCDRVNTTTCKPHIVVFGT